MASWQPLKPNSRVFNKLLRGLGAAPQYKIVHVCADSLPVLSSPPKAVIFWFSLDTHEKFLARRYDVQESEGTNNLFHMNQPVKNASEMIALIHAVLNNPDIELNDNAVVKRFRKVCTSLIAEERGCMLQTAVNFVKMHNTVAKEERTMAPDIVEDDNYHSIAFVHHNGKLYELDGWKAFPVELGDTTPENLVSNAVAACKKYANFDLNGIGIALLVNTTECSITDKPTRIVQLVPTI